MANLVRQRGDHSLFGPNARVYVLLDGLQPFDNSKLHGPKKLYQITKYTQVSSTVSVKGSNASVVLNDTNNTFIKYAPLNFLYTSFFAGDAQLTENRTNEEELNLFERILDTYGESQSPYLQALSKFIKDRGFLTSAITPMNLLFIQYLGRDGYWYSGFTGLITSITASADPRTPTRLRINAKGLERLFELSYVVTGQKNLVDLENVNQPSISNQVSTLAFTDKYGALKASEVLKNVITTVNDFFLGDNIVKRDVNGAITADYRYFKVRRLFGYGKDLPTESTSSNPKISQSGEEGYEVTDIDNTIQYKVGNNYRYKGRFENKRYHYDDNISSMDLYPGLELDTVINQGITEERDWLEVAFTKEFHNDVSPFQNVIRNNLQLFQIDKKTPKQVLDSVRRATFAYIYCDADGTLKMERPYFDTFVGGRSDGTNNKLEDAPIDYDGRYVMTTQDASYLNHTFFFDETSYVTRTIIQQKRNLIQVGADFETFFQGKSESTAKTIAKYGERELVLDAIISNGFSKGADVASSYAKASKTMLNSQAKRISLQLDQRPDLQVNRNLVFLDLAMCFVIESISTSYVPKMAMTHNIEGAYTRYVGERIINPWRIFLGEEGGESKGWTVKPFEPEQTQGYTIKRGSDSKKGFIDIYNPSYEEFKELYEPGVGLVTGLSYKSANINPKFNETPGGLNIIVARVFNTTPKEVDSHMNDYMIISYKELDGTSKVVSLKCGAEPTKQSIVKAKNLTSFARIKQGVYEFKILQDKDGNLYLVSTDFYYQLGALQETNPWSNSKAPISSKSSDSKLKEVTIAPVYNTSVQDDFSGLNEASIVIRDGLGGATNTFNQLLTQHLQNMRSDLLNVVILDQAAIQTSLPKTYYPNDLTDDKSKFKRSLSMAETSYNAGLYKDGNLPTFSTTNRLSVFNEAAIPGSLSNREYEYRGTSNALETFGIFSFVFPNTLEEFGAQDLTLEDLLVDQSRQNILADTYLRNIKQKLMSIKNELLTIMQARFNPVNGQVSAGGDINNLNSRLPEYGISFFGERVGWGSFVALAHLSYKLTCNWTDAQRTLVLGGTSKVIHPFLYLIYLYYEIGVGVKTIAGERGELNVDGKYLFQYINLFSNFGYNSNSFIQSL